MWKKKHRRNPDTEYVKRLHWRPQKSIWGIKMNNVETQTEILIQEIKKSNIYNEYNRALENLKQDTELYKKVCDFQRRRFHSQVDGDGNFMEENEQLTSRYGELAQIERAAEFLAAEQRYCMMIRKVNDRILDSVRKIGRAHV